MAEQVHITIEQTQSIVNALAEKIKAKGYAVEENLGSLAGKSEVAKTDLAASLKTEIEGKADAAATIAGYGITDAYTKQETENKISEATTTAYKPAGSVAEVSALPALTETAVGKVYNFTADFETTADFVEGAGKTYPAGTNVTIVDADTTGENPTYKYDALAGAYGTATQSGNGLMSAADKVKLDGIRLATEAEVTAVINALSLD